jgi:hypothetical protein
MSRTLYTCYNIKGIAGTIDDNIKVNIYINLIKYKIFLFYIEQNIQLPIM